MLVADGAGVDASEDHAGGAARDAAGIGGDIGGGAAAVVGGVDAGLPTVDVIHHFCREAVGIQRGLLILGVDAADVRTAGNRAEVVAGDAAGGRLAGDDGPGGTVVDGALGLVAAHDTAHLAVAGDDAGELAADEGAVVDAHDAAGGGVLGVRDGHDAPHAQGLDGAFFLHDAEEARRGVLARHRQVGDGMSVALELSAEGRDGRPEHPLEGEVLLQDDGLAHRPLIISTALGQRKQVRDAVDVNGIAVVRREHRQSDAQRQHSGQKRSRQAAQQLILLHSAPPAVCCHPVPAPHCPR